MRIALASSSQQTCPPMGYGAEMAAWDLAVSLERMGETVTLLAPKGSKVPNGGLLEIPWGIGSGDAAKIAEDKGFDLHGDALAEFDLHRVKPCKGLDQARLPLGAERHGALHGGHQGFLQGIADQQGNRERQQPIFPGTLFQPERRESRQRLLLPLQHLDRPGHGL